MIARGRQQLAISNWQLAFAQKRQKPTTGSTDNTDSHGSKKFDKDHFEFVRLRAVFPGVLPDENIFCKKCPGKVHTSK
jgi:hypothetical protein